MNSRLTILIPTYNQEQYIAQAILSAVQQDYADLEVIVGDDRSTDQTFKRAEELQAQFPGRLKIHQNQKNLGRVGNYKNLIYNVAQTDWVLILDGDDYLTNPQYISRAMAFLKSHPEVKFVFGRQQFLDNSTGRLTSQKKLDWPAVSAGTDYLLNCHQIADGIPHLSTIFNRHHAISREVQQVDCIASDSEGLFRMMAGVPIGYINELAGVWRYHEQNASMTKEFERRIHHLKMITEPTKFFLRNQIIPESQAMQFQNQMLNHVVKRNMMLFMSEGQRLKAFEYLKLVRRQIPFQWNPPEWLDLKMIFHFVFGKYTNQTKAFLKRLKA